MDLPISLWRRYSAFLYWYPGNVRTLSTNLHQIISLTWLFTKPKSGKAAPVRNDWHRVFPGPHSGVRATRRPCEQIHPLPMTDLRVQIKHNEPQKFRIFVFLIVHGLPKPIHCLFPVWPNNLLLGILFFPYPIFFFTLNSEFKKYFQLLCVTLT